MNYIIIPAAVLSVILYYIIVEIVCRLKERGFRRRLFTGVLIAALLVSQTGFVEMFTKTEAATAAAVVRETEIGAYAEGSVEVRDTEVRTITAFAALPEDIREQAVPVGTALEELVLPDTLEAICAAADADAGDDTDTSDSQVGEGTAENEDDTENVAPSDEDETPESSKDDSEEEKQESPEDDSKEETSSEGEDNGGIEDPSEEDSTKTEPSTEDEETAETAMRTETDSFVAPEYYSEHVLEVKTLEANSEAWDIDTEKENTDISGDIVTVENITWQSEPEYDGDTEGEYIFTAVIPEGYELTDIVSIPKIHVTVGGVAMLSGDIMLLAEHDHLGEPEGVEWTEWGHTDSLPSEGNYYLTADVTLTGTYRLSGTVNFCLNGNTITGSASALFEVDSGATLNIYDCVGSGKCTNSSKGKTVYANGGTVNIYGGTIDSTEGDIAVYSSAGGTVNICGGSIESTGDGNAVSVDTNGIVNISGGSIESSGEGNAVSVAGGTVYLNEGTIKSTENNAVFVTGGIAQISGGDILSAGGTAVFINRGIVNIDGQGTITGGKYGVDYNMETFTLSGSWRIIGDEGDIYLHNGARINISGELTNDSPYRVKTESDPTSEGIVITLNYVEDESKFASADERYTVRKNSIGQLELVAVSSHDSDDHGNHDDLDWKPWRDSEHLPSDRGNYYLDVDINMNDSVVKINEEINLCLNGHTIEFTRRNEGAGFDPSIEDIVSVYENGSLSIYDCHEDECGSIIIQNQSQHHLNVCGKLTVWNGNIKLIADDPEDWPDSGVNAPIKVSGVSGQVTIEGGIISADQVRRDWQNVIEVRDGGRLIVKSGEISCEDFSSYIDVSGIRCDKGGTVNISGGTITGAGYGIECYEGGTVDISEGKITGAGAMRDGIFIYSDGTVNISGGTITGALRGICSYDGTVNIRKGTITGALYGIYSDNGTVDISGGKITGSGYGLWNSRGIANVEGGTIYGGVYGIDVSGELNLSGSPVIEGGTASILYESTGIRIIGALSNDDPYSLKTSIEPTISAPVVFTSSSDPSYNDETKFKSYSDDYVVRKNSEGQLELAKLYNVEDTPDASVDRENGRLRNLIPGAEYEITYQDADGSHTDKVTADENGNLEIEDEWTGGTVDIVKKGNDDNVLDSLPQELEIPEREPSPEDAGMAKKADKDGKDGSIGGLTPGETYQFSKNGGETWEDVTADEDGEIKSVDVGSYDIRKKAGDNTLPSKSVHVEVAKENDGSGDDSGSGGSTGGDSGSGSGNGDSGSSGGSGSGSSGSGNDGSDDGGSTGGDSGSGNGGQPSGGDNGGTGTGTGTGTPGGTQPGTGDTAGTGGTGGTGNTGNTGSTSGTGSTSNTGSTGNTSNTGGTAGTGSTGNTDKADRTTGGSGDGKESGSTGSSADGDPGSPSSGGADAQTSDGSGNIVQAELENGEIVVNGGASGADGTGSGATGAAIATGTIGTAQSTTTILSMGEGAVTVTVDSDGYRGVAGVKDTVAAANAVLTPEQKQRVNGGESIEIRVEVKDISDRVSQQDKDTIESGLVDNKITDDIDLREQGELTIGAYIDISMYIRIGDGDWETVTQSYEPIEVVIGIPEELLGVGRTYYIARAHEGTFALLDDLNNEPDTITIRTELFSTYAIVFRQTLGAGADADASSGFPASLSWTAVALWSLGILVMLGIAIFLIFRKRRKDGGAAA